MGEGQTPKEMWTRRAAEIWTVIGALVLLGVAIWLLGRLTSALIPFAMALVVVLVLRRPVDLLERLGMPRLVAVLVSYLATIVVVALVGLVVGPMLVTQVSDFGSRFGEYTQKAYQFVLDVSGQIGRMGSGSVFAKAAASVRDSATAWAVSASGAIASGAVNVGSQIATLLLDSLIALLIAFYVLIDFGTMRSEVLSLFGSQAVHADRFMSITARVLGGYLRGIMLDGLAVFAMVAVGLSVLGVPGAVVIAVFAGLVNVVPYLGPATAMTLAGVAGLFVNPWLGLWAVVVVLVATQIDSIVLNPRIMAGQVDLHPVLVVFSLLTGATLFGVAGMVLAIPVAAIGKAVFMYLYEVRTGKDLASADGVLFADPDADESSKARRTEEAEGPSKE